MENFDLNSSIKMYKIDFDKVKSLQDVIEILKALDFTLFVSNDNVSENLKYFFDNGLIKETGEEKHFLRKDEV